MCVCGGGCGCAWKCAEEEPIFDAADVMRFGKDIFVHMGFTTNNSGFEWLRRHSAARGLRAHQLHFPDDMCPFHCDATFVPLRPYLAMENPSRPMEPSERKMFEVCLVLPLPPPHLCHNLALSHRNYLPPSPISLAPSLHAGSAWEEASLRSEHGACVA